jgi:hypothetical protein
MATVLGLVAPAFLAQIPWLMASFGLDILLKTVVAWQGKWLTWSRLADIAQESFGLYVLVRIFQGPILTLGEPYHFLSKFVLAIVIGIVAFEILSKLYKLVLGKSIVDFAGLKERFA